MKRMTVRELSRGRKTKVTAKAVYQMNSGQWVAEVDALEFREACSFVCQGIQACACENLQIQADLDDDGKEYKVVGS